MPFGSGHWVYIVIFLVIVLIIWGPGKLPDVGAGLGKAIKEFRKASTEVRETIVQSTAEPVAPAAPAAPPAQAPAAPAPPPATAVQPHPVAPAGNGEQQPSA